MREITNNATIAMLRLLAISTCRAILNFFFRNTYDNAISIMVNEIKGNNFLARLCGDKYSQILGEGLRYASNS